MANGLTSILGCVTEQKKMHPERYKHLAKYLADISKLTIGAGVIMRIFSPERIDWLNLTFSLLGGTMVFIISLFIVPKEA